MSSTSILSSSIATIAAGILGFLGGFFSRTGKYWLKKRERRTKLRRALLAEIQTPKDTINNAAEVEEIQDFDPVHTVIPTTTYENQVEELGLLSSHEIEPVIKYYNTAKVAKQQLDTIDDVRIKRSFIEETAPGLKKSRRDAEKVIKIHMRVLGSLRYKIKYICDVISGC